MKYGAWRRVFPNSSPTTRVSLEDEDDIFKLWPTTSDREAFRHAMHNGLAADDYENSLIVQAHEVLPVAGKALARPENPESA